MIINKVHLILLIKCPERSAVFNVPKRYLGRHILHVRLCQQVYKNANHKKNVCQSALCTDVETNPGPVFYIDPSKTISAPYSQGNQIIFGETTTAVFSNLFVYSYIQQKIQHMLTTRPGSNNEQWK
jgi:uncharacterized protein (UPF0261 family)